MLHMVGYNIKTKSYSIGKPHPIHKIKIMENLRINNPEEILFLLGRKQSSFKTFNRVKSELN